MSDVVEVAEAFKCRGCGAPLDVSPETIVAVCSYCGYPNWIREDLREDIFVVKGLDDRRIIEKAWERVRRDRDLRRIANMISFGKPYLIYLPYYFIHVEAEADYSGRVLVRVHRCSGSGKNRRCWTESHIVHVSGKYGPYKATYPILGRKGVKAFSAQALGLYYLRNPGKPEVLKEDTLGKSRFRRILIVEIDRGTAMDIALDEHLDTLREKVVERMKEEARARVMFRGTIVGTTILSKKITPKNIRIRASKIILIPMYIIPYNYRRGVYRLFLSGWDGETIVAEEPMNTLQRLLWGVAGTTLSGLLGGGGSLLLFTSFGEDPTLMGIGGLAIAIGGFISWYSIKMAIRPVRVEVVGERFRFIKEFTGRIKRVIGVAETISSFLSIEGLASMAIDEAIDRVFKD